MSFRVGARCFSTVCKLDRSRKAHVRHDIVRAITVSGTEGSKERKFTEDIKDHDDDDNTRGLKGYDGLTTLDRFQSLRKRTGVQTVRSYQPSPNAEQIMEKIVKETCHPEGDWTSVSLNDRRIKFKLLTRFMKELDHTMNSNELNNMKTVGDAVTYFTTEVKDTTVIEDMKRLDLPKNLNINTEYIRWDPENDTLFDGKTAFPGIKTKAFSVKYRRKYPPPPDDTEDE